MAMTLTLGIIGFVILQHSCEAFISPRVFQPSLHHRPKRFVVVFEQQQQQHHQRSPKPPSIPPPATEEFFERTLKEQEDVAKTVQLLQQKVIHLQTELAEKQSALEDLLQSGISIVEQEEEAAERDRLEREVELLQGELPLVQNQVKIERQRADELAEKIEDLDYMLEYQQMEFDKIQTELQKELVAERKKLQKLEATMKKREENYQSLESESFQQLKEKLKQKEKSENALLEKQKEFEVQKKRLEEELEAQAEKVKTMEAELTQQYKLQNEGTLSLQAEIVLERERFKAAKQSLKEVEDEYATVTANLKAELESQTIRANNLEKRLQQEQDRFQSTQASLMGKLQEESFRISALEEQLQTERLEARAKEKMWEDRYNHEVRVRRLKKEQMSNRYEEIRKELTALWQNARREGRQQAEKLTKKYEGVIGDLQSTIVRLERDVKAAVEENAFLRRKLEQTKSDWESAQSKRRQSEIDLSQLISRQNAEIESLQTDLKHVLDIVDEKEQEMAAFCTSWRALFKAGVKLTVQRVLVKPVKSIRQRMDARRHYKEKFFQPKTKDANRPDV